MQHHCKYSRYWAIKSFVTDLLFSQDKEFQVKQRQLMKFSLLLTSVYPFVI